MTRNWLVAASHTLWITRAISAKSRRRPTNLGVENLEDRLSLSVSHTVAPSVRSLGPGRTESFVKHGAEQQLVNDGPSLNLLVKHGSKTVVVTADGGFNADGTGRRQYKPFVKHGSAPETITLQKTAAPAWIQGMPGEDSVSPRVASAINNTAPATAHPVLVDAAIPHLSDPGPMSKMGKM